MPNKKEPLLIITVKTLLAVIIFTGVGTIIIGGGWLIGKDNKVSNNESSKSAVKEIKGTGLDNKKVELTSEEAADWNTYRKFGFEIKYPKNWVVKEMVVLDIPVADSVLFCTSDFPSLEKSITINIYNNSEALSLRDWLYKYKKSKNLDEAKIGEIVGLKSSSEIYVSKKNLIYSISSTSNNDKTLTRIFSSFRLREKNEPVLEKTFRNEKYGFEIKYPNDWEINDSSRMVMERSRNKYRTYYTVDVRFFGEEMKILASVKDDSEDWRISPVIKFENQSCTENNEQVIFVDNIVGSKKDIVCNNVVKGKIVSLSKKDKVYYFTGYPSIYNQNDYKIFNQILSTFKFTE